MLNRACTRQAIKDALERKIIRALSPTILLNGPVFSVFVKYEVDYISFLDSFLWIPRLWNFFTTNKVILFHHRSLRQLAGRVLHQKYIIVLPKTLNQAKQTNFSHEIHDMRNIIKSMYLR